MELSQESIQAFPGAFRLHTNAPVVAVLDRADDPNLEGRDVHEGAESDPLDAALDVSDDALMTRWHHGKRVDSNPIGPWIRWRSLGNRGERI